MTALDRRATLTPAHQAKLDGLADALTETVMRRILNDPAFVDSLLERIALLERDKSLRMREAMLRLLRTFERANGLPESIIRRQDAA